MPSKELISSANSVEFRDSVFRLMEEAGVVVDEDGFDDEDYEVPPGYPQEPSQIVATSNGHVQSLADVVHNDRTDGPKVHKLSRESHSDAIKAATRGSLRRLLDYENRRYKEEQDRLHQDSTFPPIFVKRNSNVSGDIILNDDASIVSGITEAFTLNGGIDEGKPKIARNTNMAAVENMTREFPAANNSTGHRVHWKGGDKNTVIQDNRNVIAETATGKYLSERLNSVSQGERIQGKTNGDNDSFKYDNAMVDIEEGVSISGGSYDWSVPAAIKEPMDSTERQFLGLQEPRYERAQTRSRNGTEPIKEEKENQSRSSTDESSGERNIVDDSSTDYYRNRGYNDDDFDGVYSTTEEEFITNAPEQKSLRHRYQQNKRSFWLIGCVCIVVICGAVVGIALNGQNDNTIKVTPARPDGGDTNGNTNQKLPATSTANPTMEPESSVTASPSASKVITSTQIPTAQPSAKPSHHSMQPSTLPSALPTLSPTLFPTSSPTTPLPTSLPTSSPTFPPTSLADILRRIDMTNAAIDISGESAIGDITSPQRMALEWMILDDDLQLNADSLNFIQRYSLSTLYFATTNNALDSWTKCGPDSILSFCEIDSLRFLSSFDECGWSGITCNADNEITRIKLREHGLAGSSIPKELTSIPSLEILSLDRNALSATVPSEIGLLSNLRTLQLNNNNLVGTIPTSLGNLINLELISLGNNDMNGTIPGEIFNSKLRGLDIDDNNFYGTLPSEMFTSSINLVNIDINGNGFEGTIPNGFGSLSKLGSLRMNSNNFEGELPPELFASSKLHTLDCSGNNLNGSLPDELYAATTLRKLDLSSNNFTGALSTKIGDLNLLIELKLQSNQFEGAIPGEMGLLSAVTSLDVSFNLLDGNMPEQVCGLRESPSSKLLELVSDCDGTEPRVTCDCCTSCTAGY